jgi:hypothetical protein
MQRTHVSRACLARGPPQAYPLSLHLRGGTRRRSSAVLCQETVISPQGGNDLKNEEKQEKTPYG